MKAYFDDDGRLVVEGENATERYALKAWWNDRAGSHGTLQVKYDRPQEKGYTECVRVGPAVAIEKGNFGFGIEPNGLRRV